MSGDDSKKVVEFPKAEVPPEERARRLSVEVDRQAHLPVSESLYYVECTDVAEKHGVSRATMKEMVEATRKANEKKAREDKDEDRQRQRRIEKAQTKARQEEEHKQREQKREQERIEKEAARKQKEKDRALAAIIKLPKGEREAKLRELAKKLGEDIELLRDELVVLVGD